MHLTKARCSTCRRTIAEYVPGRVSLKCYGQVSVISGHDLVLAVYCRCGELIRLSVPDKPAPEASA